MIYIQTTLLSISTVNAIIGIVIIVAIFQIISLIGVFRLKRKTEKEMKIELEASTRIQHMVDDMTANPDTYTDEQKSKCIQVLMSSLPSVKKEIHFKKILLIA